MNDIVTSFIRTTVPAVVAVLIDWLAHWGLNIDANGVHGLEAFGITLFTALYYLAVRLFETYVHPKFGWLLGFAKQPSYGTTGQSPVTAMPTPDPVNAK